MIRVGLALGASWLGSVNYYRNLLNAIFTLRDRQIEPVLLLGERADTGILAGLPPVELIQSSWLDPLTPRWAVRKVWQQAFGSDPLLERFLRSRDIDVLSHSDFLGSQARLPTICWIGDFQHRQLPEYFTKRERLYRDRDFKLQCQHATRILVSSHDAERALATFDEACVAKSRVLQFVAQPSLGGAATELPILEERYGFAGPYLHVPNQFWAHKNHGLILDALALLKDRGQPVLVISTGAKEDYRQPRYFAQLMARADSLGIADSFRTLGVIPQNDLLGLMMNAIALLNPSRAEGWSTSVEEAKSLGKQVILSDIPVHREQAPPDGVYVDPDDAPGLADAMSQAWATFDATVDEARRSRAQSQLPGRVQAFAERYQAIVLEVSASRMREKQPGEPTLGSAASYGGISRCPRCGGDLRAADDGWRCIACNWTSSSAGGIPILLADPAMAEHDDSAHHHRCGHKAAQAAHFDDAKDAAFEIDRPHGAPRLYRFLLGEKFRRATGPILPHLAGASALAVCGGSGMDAEFLAHAGATVVSSDLSLGAATGAKARSDKRGLGISSIVADVEHLPYGDRSVDLVAVHDGLHHLVDPDAGLLEMARVARRWVVVTEPARASITRLAVRLNLALETEEAGNRVARMDPAETKAFLETQGFVVLRAERYAMYYPHHPGSTFRLLSRPLVFPIVRSGWRLANALLGRWGNKMVVVAERAEVQAPNLRAASTESSNRSTS